MKLDNFVPIGRPHSGTVVIQSEMPTLNATLQENERHFSGIWGHFSECRIFCQKITNCKHIESCQASFNIA